jgi:hypothetical protein
MARFMEIAKGTRSRHIVALDIASGESVSVAVRVLLDTELEEIDACARAYAKAQGVEDPRPGAAAYDLVADRYTILLGCLDPESPEDNPVPFFSDVEEIREGLDREQTRNLAAAQRAWQERCSPSGASAGDPYVAKVTEEAAGDRPCPFLAYAARMSSDLQSYYGRPVCELTKAQIALFMGLRAEYARIHEEQVRR